MDGTVEAAGTGEAVTQRARRRRLRLAALHGGISAAAATLPFAASGLELNIPWWVNVSMAVVLGALGTRAGYRSGINEEIRNDTLDAGETVLSIYGVKPAPEGAPAPRPLRTDEHTPFSLTVTNRRLQLWERESELCWSHPWRELHLTADGHVLVITGPQGPIGRFVLAVMLTPEELVLASNRLRARPPR